MYIVSVVFSTELRNNDGCRKQMNSLHSGEDRSDRFNDSVLYSKVWASSLIV